MNHLVGWLSNTANLSILGAAVAVVVSKTQEFIRSRTEGRERDFQAFHRLVRELVSPDKPGEVMHIDRQAAVVFELRHFPRYYDLTRRMLAGLRQAWSADPEGPFPRLINEIDLTLEYINKKQ